MEEGMGFLTAFGLLIADLFFTIRRLISRAEEPEITSSCNSYIRLSIALGLGLCILASYSQSSDPAPEAMTFAGHVALAFAAIIGIWLLFWLPNSIRVIDLLPRQLLALPSCFVAITSIIWMYSNSFGDKAWVPGFHNLLMFLGGTMLASGGIYAHFIVMKLRAAQDALYALKKQTEAIIIRLHALDFAPNENVCDAPAKFNKERDALLSKLNDDGRALWMRIQANDLTPLERGTWNQLFDNAEKSMALIMKLKSLRVPAVVLASLASGEIRIIIHPGDGFADGGIVQNIPARLISPELRMPNTPIWLQFDDDRVNILRVQKREP